MHKRNTASEFRWDDLKIALCIARAGTLREAARELGLNASTVGRRLDALEQSLGRRLFLRSTDGLTLTAAGLNLVPIGEQMEAAALLLRSGADAIEELPRGRVRITAPPGLAERWLAPRLPALYAQYPDIRIDLDASIRYVDLGRHEADIALRSHRPQSGELVCTLLGRSPLRVVANRPIHITDWNELLWCCYGDGLKDLPSNSWISRFVHPDRVVLRGGYSAQAAAVSAGLGVMLMPQIFADDMFVATMTAARQAELAQIQVGELWLVGHRMLREVPRVAAVWAFLRALIQNHKTE